MKTKRYEGFKHLKMFGLPSPNIRTVRDASDLSDLSLHSARHGWTIRTCRHDGLNEFGLFYANYVNCERVIEIISNRLERYSNEEFYVVYESWRFLLSVNILTSKNIVIEGKYGTQKELSEGKESADFRARASMYYPSRIEDVSGEIDDNSLRWTRQISSMLRKIEWDRFYTEVAVTQDKSIVFYELRKI